MGTIVAGVRGTSAGARSPSVTGLRILYDTTCLADGRRTAGIGRYASQLLTALERHHRIELLRAGSCRRPRNESRPYRWARSQPALTRDALRASPHLVHGLSGEPLLAWPLDRQVVTVHDVEMWRSPAPPGLRGRGLRLHGRTQAALLRRCAAVIAVSRVSADEVSATLGVAPERVHVVSHGVGSTFTAIDRNDRQLLPAGLLDHEYLLWAGNLRHHDPRKGLDVLIEAIGQLGPGAPLLVLAGATGAESDRVVVRARSHGLGVMVAGHQSDDSLACLYRYALACVIPSLHEGFGLPMLEAMACGAPVVSSDAGNLGELGAGVAALAAAGDPAALSSTLRTVIVDPARRQAMRTAGIERAAEFSWERCAAATLDVYRSVLQR